MGAVDLSHGQIPGFDRRDFTRRSRFCYAIIPITHMRPDYRLLAYLYRETSLVASEELYTFGPRIGKDNNE
jgi:hypothetical protein